MLLRESYETQKFVVARFDAIKLLLDDIDLIMIRYGVRICEAGQDSSPDPMIELQDLNLDDIRSCAAVNIAEVKRTTMERSIVVSTSRLGKLRWALSDSVKLRRLVDDLRLLNESLWIALPANMLDCAGKGFTICGASGDFGSGNAVRSEEQRETEQNNGVARFMRRSEASCLNRSDERVESILCK